MGQKGAAIYEELNKKQREINLRNAIRSKLKFNHNDA